MVIGAIEERFYKELLDKLETTDADLRTQQHNRDRWPEFSGRLQEIFLTKTRDEWCEIFAGTDACFAPVLSMTEAAGHPHAQARNSYVNVDGISQPRTGAPVQQDPIGNTVAPGRAGAAHGRGIAGLGV